MKFELKNVGNFKSASIDVNGLTVIAGANATGKRTLCKAVYCLVNGFSFSETEFHDAQKAAILQALGDLPRRLSVDSEAVGNPLADELLTLKAVDVDSLKAFLMSAINRYDDGSAALGKAIYVELFGDIPLEAQIIPRLQRVLSLDKASFVKSKTGDLLNQEFRGQIANAQTEGEVSSMALTVQKHTLTVRIENGRITTLDATDFLTKQAIYIDDPFVLDDEIRSCSSSCHNLSHREALRWLLTCRKPNTLLDNLWTEDYEDVLAKISTLCTGQLTEGADGRFLYQGNCDIGNVPAGLKMFLILRQLLVNGAFENCGTLILDQPEIHLHPQWQVTLAEVLVMLQKECGLTVLLTTYSPYFLRALEVFAKVHGIRLQCRFYRTGIENGSATVTDVNDSVDAIYKEMAEPFQMLENIVFFDKN